MSDDKIKRRRFLADLLFAGGALTAAALLAQAGEAEKKPSPSPSPPKTSCPPQLDGDVAMPASPTPKPPEPALGGKPMAPQPMLRGEPMPPKNVIQPKQP
ncbi:MAG: hypothetical protein KF760_07790 [Candidatus Eremiobacteraeota bacterium]|nr:hypothetical protein [Candidatus Eremiobacteraeota bacterium]MCW5871093.1 hypothetical protein [Candidatus Eremiobacteraeota bacterium]